MAGLCIYIYLTIISMHFPSAQNWTFAGRSGNNCVSRGMSMHYEFLLSRSIKLTYFHNGGHSTTA